jgi:putative DNA primase/helicase
MSTHLETALLALELGFSPLPPKEDGSKAPLADWPMADGPSWKPYQTIPATREHIHKWYENGRTGNGLACGVGSLEAFEFEQAETHKDFLEAAWAIGLNDLVETIRQGYEESTPSGGIHWLYRCTPPEGNTKLAERPDPAVPRGRKPLIETRGRGGFIVIAPSNGKVHPTGKPYVLRSGGLRSIVTITPEERDQLWALARTFDEMPPQPVRQSKPGLKALVTPGPDWPHQGKSPGDDFEERISWADILEPHGWTLGHRRGEVDYWTRPGKHRGVSATTGHCRGLKVFSTSTLFDTQGTHSKLHVYTVLNHNGDWNAAIKALIQQGFGTWIDDDGTEKRNPPPNGWKRTQPRQPAVTPALSVPPDFDGPPRPLGVELLPVPALDPAMLPEGFRGWLADSAERMSAPLDFFAAPAIVAVAALVGRKVCVHPKRCDDWLVCPNLWGAIVGPPSVLKTPCAEVALRALERLAMEAREQHKQALTMFNEDSLIVKIKAEAAKAALKKAFIKGGTSDDEQHRLAKEAAQAEEMNPPPARRFTVNDTTVEKLGELLADNPNGLLLFRDELTGFLRTLDRQGHESDRGFYLESWNGFGSYVYDRIGRGTIFIPSTCMSLFGGIQPGPLARYLRAAAAGDDADGFIPRFQLLVYPDLPTSWVNVDRWPDTEAKSRAYLVFRLLDSLAPETTGAALDGERARHFLGFSPEAQELFDEWRDSLENALRSGRDGPLIVAHLAKYRSLMPTLALLFHLVEFVAGRSGPGSIAKAHALAAAAWCEYLEAHARRVYQSALDGDPETVAQLAERIKKSLPNPFRARDVVRKGWAGLDRTEVVECTLLVLEDRNWVKGVESLPSTMGGRPTVDYWINPAVRPSDQTGGGVS